MTHHAATYVLSAICLIHAAVGCTAAASDSPWEISLGVGTTPLRAESSVDLTASQSAATTEGYYTQRQPFTIYHEHTVMGDSYPHMYTFAYTTSAGGMSGQRQNDGNGLDYAVGLSRQVGSLGGGGVHWVIRGAIGPRAIDHSRVSEGAVSVYEREVLTQTAGPATGRVYVDETREAARFSGRITSEYEADSYRLETGLQWRGRIG